ncbi:retrovirus-related Pol polyprotein from transposon 17.6 [Trichonephila clavipes]|nr:retrovirus-related Pol polyprotein from transposon 17.6 [Trichonephila clavipes]
MIYCRRQNILHTSPPLKSGYHQVNVNPADRDKTGFVCPFGTYRFKRMPFGLKNAPATFQRRMDIFRRGLPVLAYLDDTMYQRK